MLFKASNEFINANSKDFNIDMDAPVSTYHKSFKTVLMHGSEKWEGLIPRIDRWSSDTSWLRDSQTCPSCHGLRLNKNALAITIHNRSISEVCMDTIDESWSFWQQCTWTDTEREIVEQPLKEILSRLQYQLEEEVQ